MEVLQEILEAKERLITELNEMLENRYLNYYEILVAENEIRALEEYQKILEDK